MTEGLEHTAFGGEGKGDVDGAASCPLCALLRRAGVGLCGAHTVSWEWSDDGYETPWEAARAYLAGLDAELGVALPGELARVGAACVARLADASAVEREARRADQTDRGLLRTLGAMAYQLGGDA
jgi:hypothetical protein